MRAAVIVTRKILFLTSLIVAGGVSKYEFSLKDQTLSLKGSSYLINAFRPSQHEKNCYPAGVTNRTYLVSP